MDASHQGDMPPYLKASGIDRSELTVELRADRGSASPGDTVRFVLVARNAGRERMRVGIRCGPAMDVRVTTPSGRAISVLNAQYQDEQYPVAFTCELGPYHFADARDSLVNRLWWKAPNERGDYVAAAGARGRQGLDDVSRPLTIRVR